MSIAGNVILENEKLGNIRLKIRNKLTEYGIWWNESLTVFELAERLVLMFGVPIGEIVESDIVPPQGFEYSVTLDEADVPVDWWINGVHTTVKTDSSGKSSVNVSYVKNSSGTVVCKIGRKEVMNVSYTCVPFKSFSDYAWDYEENVYDIAKYPNDISHTFRVDYVNYSEVYDLAKDTNAASAVMAIPTVYADGIDATNGIHVSAAIYQKKDSSQGWGDAIALIASKSLTHYRDTKILELGAYPGKKGLKYSLGDHVIRDVNVTTGQLTLDSQMYYFDLYYDNGYVKAIIRHGRTDDFTYEGEIGDKIMFDKFYPAVMIYDAGGHIQFQNMSIEPWRREDE